MSFKIIGQTGEFSLKTLLKMHCTVKVQDELSKTLYFQIKIFYLNFFKKKNPPNLLRIKYLNEYLHILYSYIP